MKLSKNSVDILSNFATISNSVAFSQGNSQRVMSNGKTLLAEATFDETFPNDFAIYDLGQLLSVISLFSEPAITFNEKNLVVTDEKESSHKITYRYCNPALIPNVVPKDKNITFPEAIEQFTLSADVFSKILKSVSILGATFIAFVGDGSTVKIKTFDPKDVEASAAEFTIGETTKDFQLNLDVENLRMMPDDYTVKIAANRLVLFESSSMNLKYMFPGNKDSKIS